MGLDTRDEFLSRVLDATLHIKKHEDQIRQTLVIHAGVVLRLVGFANIYYGQLQICHLNIKSQLK